MAEAADNCRYHPAVPARWYCFNCELKMCSSCVEPGYRDIKHCPQCKAAVSSLGVAHMITPFWKRLPKFFLYPLKLSALAYMAFMTALLFIAALIPLFGWLLQLVILLGFTKYAYIVLGDTARGHFDAPPADWRISSDGMSMPLKQYAIFLVTGILIFKLGFGIIGIIILLVMYFALPATAMIIATENSFFRAINPLIWGGTIARIGMPYLVLYGFLILLSGSSIALITLVQNLLPEMVLAVLFVFISMYYTLVMFNMIGYTIYQYHEELGFVVDIDYEETNEGKIKQVPQDESPVIAQLHRLIVDGKTQDAIQYLDGAIASEPDNAELLDRYYKLLTLESDPKLILKAGKKHIPAMVKLGRLNVALDLYRDCLNHNKQFVLNDPEVISTMAKNAKLLGHAKLVINLLNGFAKQFPKRHDIPDLYLLVAKTLSEELNKDATAKQVLENLIRTYPDHPSMPEIKQFHTIVSNLIANQPG